MAIELLSEDCRPWGGRWLALGQRLTGAGLAGFLLLHVFTVSGALADPWAYDLAILRMQEWDFKLMECGLVFAVALHAVNGLRVMLWELIVPNSRWDRVLIPVTVIISLMAIVGFLWVWWADWALMHGLLQGARL